MPPLSSGLVEACDDPQLLNFPLWDRQRGILQAVEGDTRVHVWRLGRRSGKTVMCALVGLWDCLLRPELDGMVRSGEKRHSVCVATSQRQATIFLDAARAIIEATPLGGMLIGSTDDELLFANRTALRALPATARGIRGLAASSVIFDEAAHALDLDGNNSAGPMFRALVPSTYQFGKHARVVISSTPLDSGGWFAEQVEAAESGEREDTRAWHFSTAQMNPTIEPGLLEQEYARDFDGYRAEVLAEFVTGGGAYLDPQRVDAAVGFGGELGRLDLIDWTLGVDLAFTRDPAAAVLVGRDPANPERLQVGLVRVWEPERAATFEEKRALEDRLLGEVSDLAAYYGARVVIDQMLSPQVEAFLGRRGITVETLHLSAESKTLAFAEVRSRIYDGTLELLDDERLIGELKGLRTSFVPGRARVLTPRTSRGHSDVAVATALSVLRLQDSGNVNLSASSGWEPSGEHGLDGLLGEDHGIGPSMSF